MAYVSQQDKKELAPAIKKVLSKYGMKGSISIRNHSTLQVTLQSGAIDFKDYSHGDGYIQVNTYHIDSHYSGKAKAFLNELLAAMKGPKYFNNDDAMTDYFHRSHYTDINVGKWNKPYFLQETAKKAPKKPVQASKTIKVPANATISNAAENIARMSNAERDKLVNDLIASYPNLADEMLTKIGFGLMDVDND
jgi:hypothetical protein